MLKDFPSKLFSSERAKAVSFIETSTNYDLAKNISKLTYNYPQEITHNPTTNQAECLTQMYLAGNCLTQTSGLLPWRGANQLRDGYDLYFDLKLMDSAKEEQQYSIAECKGTLARFYPSLFAKGKHQICEKNQYEHSHKLSTQT